MFSWLRPNPIKRLEKQYQAKMKEAYDAEKFGDRLRQADIYEEAELIRVKLEKLEAEQASAAD